MVYILIFLFLFYSEINALLEKGQLLADAKRSVMLFSDNHDDYPMDDERQRSDMMKVLTAREQSNMNHLHFFVEQPVFLSRLACTPKVTTHVIEDSAQFQFRSTDVEDIEIRKNAIAAAMILDKQDPTSFSRSFFGSVTFVDILNEFNHYFMRMQYSKALLKKHADSACIKEIFDSLFYEQQHFIDVIHELGVNPSQTILNTMLFTYKRSMMRGDLQRYDSVRRRLQGSIIDFSKALLNLHILYTMASLPEGDDIALVAGTYHADFIVQALAGNQRSRYKRKRIEHCLAENCALQKKSVGLSAQQIFHIILGK